MHTPAVGPRVDTLPSALWQARGTDLLLTPGTPPQIRVDGKLAPLAGQSTLTGDDTQAILAELLTADQLAKWESAHDFDFSFSWATSARVRGNAFLQRGHTALAL